MALLFLFFFFFMCEQRNPRSDCAIAQSDLGYCCPLNNQWTNKEDPDDLECADADAQAVRI